MLSNVIIIAVVLVLVSLSIKGTVSHFKGEGSCCGGGGRAKLKKPQKLDKVIAQKKIGIEGMVCDNCAARVHNALNSIDGINARVERSKSCAVIKLGREIDEEMIKKTVEDLGYRVTGINGN
ncbi:MAG: cation transporter [Lachnospiraceae bacterium]|nr:cation transporter [Lachnospiraceae bacterium]